MKEKLKEYKSVFDESSRYSQGAYPDEILEELSSNAKTVSISAKNLMVLTQSYITNISEPSAGKLEISLKGGGEIIFPLGKISDRNGTLYGSSASVFEMNYGVTITFFS